MSSCAQVNKDKACGDRASPAVRALSGDTVKPNVVQESTGPLVSGNVDKKDLNGTDALSGSRSGDVENSVKNEDFHFINKKRKRLVKKPVINSPKNFVKDITKLKKSINDNIKINTVKKFIDDQACEEDSDGDIKEPSCDEDDENEYDLNDPFIDDSEKVKDDRSIY